MGIFSDIKSLFWPSPNQSGGILVRDHFPGAWQRNQEIRTEDALTFHAVYACMNRIASDIGKLPIGLVKKDEFGLWQDYESPAFSPVVRRPNSFQTPQQFYEHWQLSLLSSGNTYVIKERDARGIVIALYVLDPLRVRPMTANDGTVAYECDANELANLGETVLVPASEMIHDRISALHHPLVGVSPIAAAAAQVAVAVEIQGSSVALHRNQARPGGALFAPGAISQQTADEIKTAWETNFGGRNAGKVAVLADGLQWQSFDTINAQNGQVVEQLQWSAEVVCSVFAVPPHMVQLGDASLKYDNVAALNQQYYSQTLMPRLEAMESLLNHGLGLPRDVSTQFSVTTLLRMDMRSLAEVEVALVSGGIKTTDEARRVFNLPPVAGGSEIFRQQQDFPISVLANRRDGPGGGDVTRYFNTLQKLRNIEHAK